LILNFGVGDGGFTDYFLGPLSLPWHNSFFSFIVVKFFGITVKKALKNKVETCICAVWLAHLIYMAG
jgi:hypothetical protein